jgi:hypothetical protein
MLAAMTDTDVQSKLAEYEGIVRLLTAKLEELAAENTRLRSEKSDALSVCKEVYSDPAAPAALRLKAAGLALPHETRGDEQYGPRASIATATSGMRKQLCGPIRATCQR